MPMLCCSSSVFALLCVALVIPVLLCAISISDSEYNSLKNLYDATNGAAWKWQEMEGIWNFTNSSSDPCLSYWQGVNCTDSGSTRSLIALVLPGYNLNGTLPASIGNLIQLQVIDFERNFLTGTIPSALGYLLQLQYLDLRTNTLIGTIPSTLGDLTHLQYLDLGVNSLTDTIPSTLCYLSQLQWLNVDLNFLNGTIPSTIGNLTELRILDLGWNSLTGDIPSNVGNLTHLYSFDVGPNLLKGTIPLNFFNLTELQYFDLWGNSFTGTIPSSLSNLEKLLYLGLEVNSLTGTIPSTLGNLSRLLSLGLESNSLEGTIPSTLSLLMNLEVLLLQNNMLRGRIPDTLVSSGTIDVSNNMLIGKIPSAIFSRNNLTTFAASENCLSIEIPISICKQPSLKYLILNGVGNNPRCWSYPSMINNIFFPSCIWSMQSLQQLFIAGNGLKGDLNIFEMPKLRILNINTNKFTGTLAPSIRFHPFEVLDISFNQITGYMKINSVEKRVSLSADVNRLSGPVNSDVIDTFESVNVISGNSISCNTLPKIDIAYTSSPFFAECNTRYVFFSIIIWTLTLGGFLLICAINYKNTFKCANLWLNQYKFCVKTEGNLAAFPKSIQFIFSLQKLQKLMLLTSLCIIAVLIVIYSGFEFSKNSKADYRVQYEKYDYAFSGVFLKSVSPAAILLIVFMLASFVFVYIVYRVFLSEMAVLYHATIFFRYNIVSTPTKNQVFFKYLLLSLFLCISLAINVAFVYGLSHTEEVLPLQIAFVCVNSLYKDYVSNKFLSYIRNKSHLTKKEADLFHAIVITFAVIINPCLATLVIDTDCFYYYFFNRSVINVSYPNQFCGFIDIRTGKCAVISEYLIPSSFIPPFLYGHHCRDAVLGNYIPVIILSCALNSFVYPFWYNYKTSGIQSLNTQTVLFTFSFDSRKLVFISHLLEGIIFDLVLMILFGIVYPLCLLFLLIDASSRIYLLIRCVVLYITLHQRTIYNNPELCKGNSDYLEDIVSDAVVSAPYLIWPGLGAASIIFGFYLFDMAYDTKDNDLGAPITLLILSSIFFVVMCVIFYMIKAKTYADLATRVESANEIQSQYESRLSNEIVGVELQAIENPICIPTSK